MLSGNRVIYKKVHVGQRWLTMYIRRVNAKWGGAQGGGGWVGAGMDISEGSATDRPSSLATYRVSSEKTKRVRKSCTVAVRFLGSA